MSETFDTSKIPAEPDPVPYTKYTDVDADGDSCILYDDVAVNDEWIKATNNVQLEDMR